MEDLGKFKILKDIVFLLSCSETTLIGKSQFHISTILGIEPGYLMTGSKGLTHLTSETVTESCEIAGSGPSK